VVDAAEAARLAAGESEMPDEWFRLLTDTPEEAALWRGRELRRSLRRG
jgi:hypothetical protein